VRNPSLPPPPRSGEGEQKGNEPTFLPFPQRDDDSPSPPLRFGEGVGGRGLLTTVQGSWRIPFHPANLGVQCHRLVFLLGLHVGQRRETTDSSSPVAGVTGSNSAEECLSKGA